MGIKNLNGPVEQDKETLIEGGGNSFFNEKKYHLGLSEIETEKKKREDEKEAEIKGLKEKLLEDENSELLDKIDSSVFENVVNPEELKDICKKSIKNGMLEFDENEKIVGVYIEVGGEKRPSNLFKSLIDGGFSPEQALKSWLQVRTESFKNWFGDWENNSSQASKIVDKNGEPLVMWHGTTRKLNEFSHNVQRNRVNKENTKDRFYFGTEFNLLKRNYADNKINTIDALLKVILDIIKNKYNHATIFDFIKEYNDMIEEIFGSENKSKLEKNGAIYYYGKNKNYIDYKYIIDTGFGSQASWISLAEGRKPTLDDFEKGSYVWKVGGGKKIRLDGIYLPKTGINGYMLPFFIKGTNISEEKVDDLNFMDGLFDSAISKGNSDTDIISIQTGTDQYIGVKNASQIKSAVDNDGTFLSEEGKFNDYFGKNAKLTTSIDSKVVYRNQYIINIILLSNQTLEEKNLDLSRYISEQYFSITGENLVLTESQLESIIKSYGIKGTIGRLSLDKLKQKNEILSETITDPKIRRFLLESGLC